jgi:RNA polymerase sigma factor (sigma-70 family)
MDTDLATLIRQVQLGNVDAYELVVQRFQDMAVGYSCARLGDVHLAEDAAQEAFVTAYFALPSLHEPAAFPGWFRRIVIKHIDRIQRTRRSVLALDHLANAAATQPSPVDLIEQQEVHHVIACAIQSLPLTQREVVTLYYLSDYSYTDISAFLAIPLSTVKMRLYHARRQLQHQLVELIEEVLPRQRPSRDGTFVEKIMSFQVETKGVPAQTVITRTRQVFITDLQAHLDSSIKDLMSYVTAQGVQIVGLPFSIYHGKVREDSAASVEVCLPIMGPIQPGADMQVQDLPAMQVASAVTTLRQSLFPGVLKAYDAVWTWIEEHGHQAGDHPHEIYLNFRTSIFSPTASLDDPCVEIVWPYH